jgi:hypothetical protein
MEMQEGGFCVSSAIMIDESYFKASSLSFPVLGILRPVMSIT